MLKVIAQILALLTAAAQAVQQWQSSKRAAEREKAIRDAQGDPAGWLDDHFNGVRDMPDDADKARKADAPEPDTDR